jgi:hypothetical protein
MTATTINFDTVVILPNNQPVWNFIKETCLYNFPLNDKQDIYLYNGELTQIKDSIDLEILGVFEVDGTETKMRPAGNIRIGRSLKCLLPITNVIPGYKQSSAELGSRISKDQLKQIVKEYVDVCDTTTNTVLIDTVLAVPAAWKMEDRVFGKPALIVDLNQNYKLYFYESQPCTLIAGMFPFNFYVPRIDLEHPRGNGDNFKIRDTNIYLFNSHGHVLDFKPTVIDIDHPGLVEDVKRIINDTLNHYQAAAKPVPEPTLDRTNVDLHDVDSLRCYVIALQQQIIDLQNELLNKR